MLKTGMQAAGAVLSVWVHQSMWTLLLPGSALCSVALVCMLFSLQPHNIALMSATICMCAYYRVLVLLGVTTAEVWCADRTGACIVYRPT